MVSGYIVLWVRELCVHSADQAGACGNRVGRDNEEGDKKGKDKSLQRRISASIVTRAFDLGEGAERAGMAEDFGAKLKIAKKSGTNVDLSVPGGQ
jgi:hypothetical protein